MAVEFKQVTLQNRVRIPPGVPIDFEDPDAEPYFKNLGVATSTRTKAVITYSQAEISVDPSAVFADGPQKGQTILPAKEG